MYGGFIYTVEQTSTKRWVIVRDHEVEISKRFRTRVEAWAALNQLLGFVNKEA